jgi:hypothetical protein
MWHVRYVPISPKFPPDHQKPAALPLGSVENLACPHLITNETQLTHGLRNMLFLRCLPFLARAGAACGDTERGPQIRPKRLRGGVANSETTTWAQVAPGAAESSW